MSKQRANLEFAPTSLQWVVDATRAGFESHGVAGVAIYAAADHRLQRIGAFGDAPPWTRLPRCIGTTQVGALESKAGAAATVGIDELLTHATEHTLEHQGRNIGTLFIAKPTVDEPLDHFVQVFTAVLSAFLRDENAVVATESVNSEMTSTEMLSAGVAHELNNPLNVVLGLSQLMQSNESLPAAVRNDAAVIVSEASRAVGVVRQLLSYGRGGGLTLEVVNIAELVAGAVSFYESSEPASGIIIDYERVDPSLLVLADPYRFQHAILAILKNAQQAIVRVAAPGGIMRIVGTLEADTVRLSFTDNGPGICADVLPRIFDPFFTTREIETGTGMGLALVRKAMAEIDGTVVCRSDPTDGTEFVITLPRHLSD